MIPALRVAVAVAEFVTRNCGPSCSTRTWECGYRCWGNGRFEVVHARAVREYEAAS